MILLDTNAIIWLSARHRRTASLIPARGPYCISPVSLLELSLLADIGKLRMKSLDAVKRDPRWTVDEASALELFEAAADLRWTRDIFDRLIVAHALSHGFKLATSDSAMLANLPARMVIEL